MKPSHWLLHDCKDQPTNQPTKPPTPQDVLEKEEKKRENNAARECVWVLSKISTGIAWEGKKADGTISLIEVGVMYVTGASFSLITWKSEREKKWKIKKWKKKE